MSQGLYVLLFLLLVSIRPISSYLYVSYNNGGPRNVTITMFKPFSIPYANLPSAGITGYLAQFSCDDGEICRDPSQYITQTQEKILLMKYCSDGCMLDIAVYAKSVGYIGILTYGDNATITDDITNTGLPFAIIDSDYVDTLLTKPTGKVQVYGSIIVGLIIVTSSLILFICCCCCCCFCIFCCCSMICSRCCLTNVGDYEEIDYLARREELIESILARLQEMDQGLPLGREATKTFPVRLYGDDEQLDSCVICVEDFEVGKKVKELPCQHIFHPCCIDEWLNNHSSVCPLCKKDLTGIVGDRGSDSDSCSSLELSRSHNNNYYGSV